MKVAFIYPSKIVAKTKTKVISAGIDIDKFKSIKKTVFPFIKESTIKVAYVAALTFEKDHLTFLKTAELILKEHKNITFYWVLEQEDIML